MRFIYFSIVLVLALALPGCEAIGFIFQAGMWIGLIGAVLVIGIIAFIVSKLR